MRLVILAASALLVLAGAKANAQTIPAAAAPGQIEGRLTDSTSGAPIAIGSITIRRQRDTSFVGGALPKADGTFRVDGLAPGQYSLRFRAIGYAPITLNGLAVTA